MKTQNLKRALQGLLTITLFASNSLAAPQPIRRGPSATWLGLRPIPQGEINPFGSCRANHLPAQANLGPQSAEELLASFRDHLAEKNQAQLQEINDVQSCLSNPEACRSRKAQKVIAEFKEQIQNNLPTLRLYMALLETSRKNARAWSGPEGTAQAYLVRPAALARIDKNKLPFPAKLSHLFPNLPDKIEPLSDDEVRNALEIFNKDAQEFMRGFNPVVLGRNGQPLGASSGASLRLRQTSHFDRNVKEMVKFYSSKYAGLLGHAPILSFYTQARYSREGLNQALESFKGNLVDFSRQKLARSYNDWDDLKYLILLQSDMNAFLKEHREYCEVAHQLNVTARFDAWTTKMVRSWGVFAGVTVAMIVTGGACTLVCAGAGLAASTAFLVTDYVTLDQDDVAAFRNPKTGDPQELLELRMKYKKFQLGFALYIVSAAVTAGLLTSSTSLLSGQVRDLLAANGENLTTQILAERLTARAQSEVENRVLYQVVITMNELEKELAQPNKLRYYHNYLGRMRTLLTAKN